MPAPDTVLEVLEARFDDAVEDLVSLARIPSVSAASFDPAEVERSAAAVVELLQSTGLDKVEVLRLLGGRQPILTHYTGESGPRSKM